MDNFTSFDLSPQVQKAVKELGYKTPTPIQKKTIPFALDGKDILGIAMTGTGKTAAFSLPLVDLLTRKNKRVKTNHIRSLILTPTRELADQIEENIMAFSKNHKLEVKAAFGGVSKNPQIDALSLGLDVLIATPGRLKDLYDHGHIDYSELEIFILDEADTMLSMGFYDAVCEVTAKLPKKIQTLLFSATMPTEIEKLADSVLVNPIKVFIASDIPATSIIPQKVFFLKKADKMYALGALLDDPSLKKVLVFCKTKLGGDRIVEQLLKMAYSVDILHSNRTQAQREQALKKFRDGDIRVLIATDVAARGIHVDDISHVINYNMPEDPNQYIHRIGRTARAGESGLAISFCVESELEKLQTIEKLIKHKLDVDESHPFYKEMNFTALKKAKKNKKKKKAKSKRR